MAALLAVLGHMFPVWLKFRGSRSHADSVVALRAETGELVWAFQTVHHDVWDYDLPAQPTLAR
ncbi:MAG: glycerol-3-phosphate acyltransferase, partial [Candidatus Sulfotelmatobacter sp.]